MSAEQKPGDPADKGLDTFQPTTNHRAGYGDDKLARLVDYLRQRPSATLASGEGALLLAEIDRLRARCRQIDDEAYDYAEQIEQLKAAATDSADHYADARAEIDRLRRILAALREPSEAVVMGAHQQLKGIVPGYLVPVIRAAVAAAEQEVERE